LAIAAASGLASAPWGAAQVLLEIVGVHLDEARHHQVALAIDGARQEERPCSMARMPAASKARFQRSPHSPDEPALVRTVWFPPASGMLLDTGAFMSVFSMVRMASPRGGGVGRGDGGAGAHLQQVAMMRFGPSCGRGRC